jgi:hypothetical protein
MFDDKILISSEVIIACVSKYHGDLYEYHIISIRYTNDIELQNKLSIMYEKYNKYGFPSNINELNKLYEDREIFKYYPEFDIKILAKYNVYDYYETDEGSIFYCDRFKDKLGSKSDNGCQWYIYNNRYVSNDNSRELEYSFDDEYNNLNVNIKNMLSNFKSGDIIVQEYKTFERNIILKKNNTILFDIKDPKCYLYRLLEIKHNNLSVVGSEISIEVV